MRINLRKFFGFIELMLGLMLIILIIGSILSLGFFGNNLMSKLKLGNVDSNVQAFGTLYLMNLFTLGLIGVGFTLLFFVLGIILIINGILDLKGE